MKMMEKVVDPEDGVAPGAQVPGYRVAGKTGTAQRVGKECGCYDGTFTVSFAGFAPADDPRFTVYVVVQRPKNGGGGGSVGGPAFSKIMSYALRRYAVPPTGTKPSDLPVEWGRRWPVPHGRAVTSRSCPNSPTEPSDRRTRRARRWPRWRDRLPVGADDRRRRRHRRHRHLAELAAGPARRPVRRAPGRPRPRHLLPRRRGGGRCRRRADRPARARVLGARLPAVVVDRPRQVLGGVSAEVYGHPAERLRMIGVTGTQGKTTTTRLLESGLHARASRVPSWAPIGTRVARAGREDGADHAGGARPARALRADGRARCRGVRDGGVQPRAGDGARRRRRLRRRGVHQPRPRPPRLPRRRRGLLPRQGAPLHPRARRAGRWSTSTTSSVADWSTRRGSPCAPSRSRTATPTGALSTSS